MWLSWCRVTKLDLVDIIKANTGKEVDKDDIELPEIKEVGEYVCPRQAAS